MSRFLQRSFMDRGPFLLLAIAALASSGCASGILGIVVILTEGGGGGGSDRATATIHAQGGVTVDQLPITGGCVVSDTCRVNLCSTLFPPTGSAKLTCDDPVLAEWPDGATLVSATWSAPALQVSGSILVEPAASYIVPPSTGPLITDPGHSAYVLSLDSGSLGPANFELTFVFDFDRDVDPIPCVKAVQVTTLEVLPIGSGPRFVLPAEDLGFDFTAIPLTDPHTFCLEEAVPVTHKRWSDVKRLFRE